MHTLRLAFGNDPHRILVFFAATVCALSFGITSRLTRETVEHAVSPSASWHQATDVEEFMRKNSAEAPVTNVVRDNNP